MITPLLESLIIQGKARFKNWSFGYSQIGRIPVSDNDTAIITGFMYFPCLLANALQTSGSIIQYLKIEGDKSTNDYVIKSPYNVMRYYNPNTQVIETLYTPGSPVKFDTYLVHNSDIKIRLAVSGEPLSDVFVQAPPPSSVNEPAPPSGFGGLNTINEIILGNTGLGDCGDYNPLSKKLQNNVGDKEQLSINFLDRTLPDIAQSIINVESMGIPIINFEVVFINKAFLDIGSNK